MIIKLTAHWSHALPVTKILQLHEPVTLSHPKFPVVPIKLHRQPNYNKQLKKHIKNIFFKLMPYFHIPLDFQQSS